MKGRTHALDKGRIQRTLKLYKLRFPFIGQLKSVLHASSLYQFSPEWMRIIDNREGFGIHFEFNF